MSRYAELSFTEEIRLRTLRTLLDANPLKNCFDMDPEIFYESPLKELRALARDTCGPCVLKQACLEKTLLEQDPFGVQGGKTPAELKRIISEQNRERRLAS